MVATADHHSKLTVLDSSNKSYHEIAEKKRADKRCRDSYGLCGAAYVGGQGDSCHHRHC